MQNNQPKKHTEQQLAEQLKSITEQLFGWIAYTSQKPKNHEKVFHLLATFMILADSGFLSPEEEKRCIDEMEQLTDQFSGGCIRMNDPNLTESLTLSLRQLHDSNPKAHLLSMTFDIEYLLQLNPVIKDPSLTTEDCNALLAPFRERSLNGQLENFEIKPIAKNLQQIRNKISQYPDSIPFYINHLKRYGERLGN